MTDELLEELVGLVEAWRDDAAGMRDDGGPDLAMIYDECADELTALIKRISEAK